MRAVLIMIAALTISGCEGPSVYRVDGPSWRTYRNYDYNRPEGSSRYDASRYYRDGRYYRERRLGPGERIYRGLDGKYYCRRPDGTTGLIIGAIAGGALGSALAPGDSELLGAILGAGAGALIGREIDRGEVRCR